MRRTYELDYPFELDPHEVRALDRRQGGEPRPACSGPDLRLPVPPASSITTATCREVPGRRLARRASTRSSASGWPSVEAATGRRFGDPADPLLVSVRSGAPVSMPGMMDTILNLGLTAATTEGLAAATGDAAFAAACRDRLESMFRGIVGVEPVPDDPWEQLRLAVEAVFRSWNSDRAIAYRRREGIPDDLGTAVTVQAMVFGNLGADSATGVAFTRNPATGEPVLYGDVLFDAQGEDVVAGTHRTEPIARPRRAPARGRRARCARPRPGSSTTCATCATSSSRSSRAGCGCSRSGSASGARRRRSGSRSTWPKDPVVRAVATPRRWNASPRCSSIRRRVTTGRSGYVLPLLTGLGASPGVASGEIVDVARGRGGGRRGGPARDPRPRRDLARRRPRHVAGGRDPHGAGRARQPRRGRRAGLGHPRGRRRGRAPRSATAWSRSAAGRCTTATTITIDGASGEVFAGVIPGRTEVVPQAAILLGWAAELGVRSRRATRPPAPSAAARRRRRSPVTLDACRPAARDQGVRDDRGRSRRPARPRPTTVQPLLDQLLVDGVAASVAGAYRLTDAGSERGPPSSWRADRAAWGVEPAAATALDAFLELDHRMKEIVTDWQLRPGERRAAGQRPRGRRPTTPGSSTGSSALDAEAASWLAPLESASARLRGYRERLGRAVERAPAGDGKLRRVAARRQLPRRVVRAPRGPDRARRPDARRARPRRAARDRAGVRAPSGDDRPRRRAAADPRRRPRGARRRLDRPRVRDGDLGRGPADRRLGRRVGSPARGGRHDRARPGERDVRGRVRRLQVHVARVHARGRGARHRAGPVRVRRRDVAWSRIDGLEAPSGPPPATRSTAAPTGSARSTRSSSTGSGCSARATDRGTPSSARSPHPTWSCSRAG